MITKASDLEIVGRKARRYRDRLRNEGGRLLTDSERHELAHLLDELQHYALRVASPPKGLPR